MTKFNSILATSVLLNVILGVILYAVNVARKDEVLKSETLESVYHNLAIESSKLKTDTRVVTRTIRSPDGTVTIEKSTDKSVTEDKAKVSEKSVETKKVTSEQGVRPSQSMTVLIPLKREKYGKYDPRIYYGLRLGNLPAEAVFGGNFYVKEYSLGIRWEF